MGPQFPHKTQQEETRWLSPLLPSFLAAMSLIVTVDLASLAVAAECQLSEQDGETVQGMTAWKGVPSSTLSLTNTITRDIYGGGFAPSLVPESAPNNSRFVWGNMVGQEIATIGACLRQDIRKSARFNQAAITSLGKPNAKAHKPAMKVSILPYSGKRQVSRMRTTLLEIGISVHDQPPIIIGPVQETRNLILSGERRVSQSVATPPIGRFPSFGGQPFVALNPFQSALQLPDNESLRMNLTTTQVLHEGNCANGCP